MYRVEQSPEALRWARKREGFKIDDLRKIFPGLADFRTDADQYPYGISLELMDSVRLMYSRQHVIITDRMEDGREPADFVGTASLSDDPAVIGRKMRQVLGFADGWARRIATWKAAVNKIRKAMEALGVMAVIANVHNNDNRRRLDPGEFLGFAIGDPRVPLIFVNGAAPRSAHMYLLAYEFAHLWLGDVGNGISGFRELQPDGGEVEQFCHRAASEFLVPLEQITTFSHIAEDNEVLFVILSTYLKASQLVIARRALDLDLIGHEEFSRLYHEYTWKERQRGWTGNFIYNQDNRIGRLFATSLIRAVAERCLNLQDAYYLTGLKEKGLQRYALELGLMYP